MGVTWFVTPVRYCGAVTMWSPSGTSLQPMGVTWFVTPVRYRGTVTTWSSSGTSLRPMSVTLWARAYSGTGRTTEVRCLPSPSCDLGTSPLQRAQLTGSCSNVVGPGPGGGPSWRPAQGGATGVGSVYGPGPGRRAGSARSRWGAGLAEAEYGPGAANVPENSAVRPVRVRARRRPVRRSG